MRSVGGLLLVLGFGSLILPMFDMQFTILQPVEPFQPVIGMVAGIVGLALVVMPELMARRAGGAVVPATVPSDGDPNPPA